MVVIAMGTRMDLAQEFELEVCSSCGAFVSQLNEETGWCDPCSGVTPTNHCEKCNSVISSSETKCSHCKYFVWLENNADEIERVMASGSVMINAATAKKLVRDNNRPICQSCGNPIKGGTKGRHFFCKKTPYCIKAHNAYHYYRRVRNLSHNESLVKAKTAALILKLTG